MMNDVSLKSNIFYIQFHKMLNSLSCLTFVGEDSEATAKAGETHRQQLAQCRVVVVPTASGVLSGFI